jgi:dipeptidase
MIAYNADSGNLMGMLYHYPSLSNTDERTKRKVYNWDSGVYLGEIPEANSTYNVVGNTNERGLVIAETTFGGLSMLDPENQPDAKLDYGSLIYITLQRAEFAREAIVLIGNLLDEFGYASEGESFSLADRKGEVWIMELIGRGGNGIGAAWVARKVPDGYVAAHSNQARITTFPRNAEDCLYSNDVVQLAKDIGVYTSPEDDPNDLNFSFSDTYDPLTFMGARASEARTWSIFSSFLPETSFQSAYEDYALGNDLTHRMPLWIEPTHKLSYNNVVKAMSSHYENTALASDSDPSAGPNNAPYRPRPLEWTHEGKTYHNERTVGTHQTGWNFIAQIRLTFPPPIASLLWFAVDDSSTSPRFPVYGCSTSVSEAYGGKGTQDGVPSPLLNFDLGHAFWVQNMVSNFVYTRWREAYPVLQEELARVQSNFHSQVQAIDAKLMDLYTKTSDDDLNDMVKLATQFSISAGDEMHKSWLEFYGTLFSRFRDFFEILPDEKEPTCKCQVKEVGFTESWKETIIKETGTRYGCRDDSFDLRVHKGRLRESSHHLRSSSGLRESMQN